MQVAKFETRQVFMGMALLLPIAAFAATTGAEFLAIYNWISGIVSGYGGKAVAIAAIAVGALLSLGKSNPMPILAGIGFAIFLAYLPGVVNGMLTATM